MNAHTAFTIGGVARLVSTAYYGSWPSLIPRGLRVHKRFV